MAGGSIVPLFSLLASHDPVTRADSCATLVRALGQRDPASPSAGSKGDGDLGYALDRLTAGLASHNPHATLGFAVALCTLLDSSAASSSGLMMSAHRTRDTLDRIVDPPAAAAHDRDGRGGGADERASLFARLAGLHALLRADAFTHTPEQTTTEFSKVAQALVALARKKSWLAQPAYWSLCDVVKRLLSTTSTTTSTTTTDESWRLECVKQVLQLAFLDGRERGRALTPDKLALVLTVRLYGGKDAHVDLATCLRATPFRDGDPLRDEACVAHLAKLLSGAAATTTTSTSQGSSAAPSGFAGANATKVAGQGAQPFVLGGARPHFIWDILLDLFFSPSSSTTAGVSFADFWRQAVDDALLGPAASTTARKSTALAVLQLALARATQPHQVVTLLSGPNTLRTLANHVRKGHSSSGAITGGSAGGAAKDVVEKVLARAADKTLTALESDTLARVPQATYDVLVAMVLRDDAWRLFDSRTVDRLVARLDPEGAHRWALALQGVILNPLASGSDADADDDDTDDDDAEMAAAASTTVDPVTVKRIWALDALLALARAPRVTRRAETLERTIEFLLALGWFTVVSKKGAKSLAASSKPEPALPSSVAEAARSRLYSVLASVLPTSTTTAEGDDDESRVDWLARALDIADSLAKDKKHLARRDDVPAPALALATTAREMVAKVERRATKSTASAEDKHRLKALRLLMHAVVLISMDEEEPNAAANDDDEQSLLQRFVDAVPALFPSVLGGGATAAAAAADAADDEDVEMEGEAPEPATLLVDLVLALTQRSLALARETAQLVFAGFVDDMGEQSIELLLDHVRPVDAPGDDVLDEPVAKGHEPSSGESDSEDSESDSESDSDSDSDSDGDDSDEDGGEVDEAFRNELLAALEAGGLAPLNDEQLSSSGDDEDGDDERVPKDAEEELLDDDQMLALDEKLADIFRQQRSRTKRSRTAAKMDDSHFRMRVLDFVETLARHRPESELVVYTIVPLMRLSASTSAGEKELASKASRVLRGIVSGKKGTPAPLSPERALTALRRLCVFSRSLDMPELGPLLANAGVYLAKAILASPEAGPGESHAVAQTVADAFDEYLTRKNTRAKAQPRMTLEFARRVTACAWLMFERVAERATPSSTTTSGGGGGGGVVNAFRRMQAFEVLQALVVARAAMKTDESKSDIVSKVPVLREAIVANFLHALDDTTGGAMDATRLRELCKVALAAARASVPLAGSPAHAREMWASAQLESVLARLQHDSDRFKNAAGLHNLVKQVIGATSPAAPAASGEKKHQKRKAEAANDGLESKGSTMGKGASKKSKKQK